MEPAKDLSASYRVVSNGQISPGFELSKVQNAFAELFKIPLDKAKTLVGTKRVIKQGLSEEQAQAYKQRLEKIGMVIRVEGGEKPKPKLDALSLVPIGNEKAAAAPTPPKPAPIAQAVAKPASALKLALEPIPGQEAQVEEDQKEPAPQSQAPAAPKAFACPKCHLEQERSKECIGCGIIFAKYRGNNEATSAVAGPASNATSPNPEAETDAAEISINEEELNIKALGAAAIAAIAGALIWLSIALATGYEIGYVAWGIGGGIGFAATLFGSKGQTAGIACGTLALISIVLGQYLVFSNFEYGYDFEEGELEEIYEYFSAEAPIYFEEVHDDESLIQFMREYGYSDYYIDEETIDEEIEYFNSYTVPEFKYIVENNPSYEQWKTRYIENFENSEPEYVAPSFASTLDFKSLIFLFLGVGTAYQLGSRGTKLNT